jgi:hypothetical protein
MKDSLDFRECKICHNVKVRIRQGEFPDGKSPKYCDQFNKLWNGLNCPECNVDKTREKMKKSRANKKGMTEWLQD